MPVIAGDEETIAEPGQNACLANGKIVAEKRQGSSLQALGLSPFCNGLLGYHSLQRHLFLLPCSSLMQKRPQRNEYTVSEASFLRMVSVNKAARTRFLVSERYSKKSCVMRSEGIKG